MTISACYLSREGLVLGADSTTTIQNYSTGQCQYFDHNQKILEIGEGGMLGVVTWGLNGLGQKSYRTVAAEFADDLEATPPLSVDEVANRWSQRIWAEYTTNFADRISRYRDLSRMDDLTEGEEIELEALGSLSGGFCIGGRVSGSRIPSAYAVCYGPEMDEPEIEQIEYDKPRFWGVPNLMNRLFLGVDSQFLARLLDSGKWQGSEDDLIMLVNPGVLSIPGPLPIREAIDWVFSAIFITIKAVKFSAMPPICGGPIEIAVITTDRKFRWVKHKRMDEVLRQTTTQGSLP